MISTLDHYAIYMYLQAGRRSDQPRWLVQPTGHEGLSCDIPGRDPTRGEKAISGRWEFPHLRNQIADKNNRTVIGSLPSLKGEGSQLLPWMLPV
jgi:hypothetical protein